MPNITVEEISENNMTKAAIRLLFICKKRHPVGCLCDLASVSVLGKPVFDELVKYGCVRVLPFSAL